MKNSTNLKPLAFTLGTGFVNAADNPFRMPRLPGDYIVTADIPYGKCGASK